MNLFLAKKTTPLKSKLAKIFAIFLVYFFVGISTNIISAQMTPSVDGSSSYRAPVFVPNSQQKNAQLPLPKDFGTKFSSAEFVPSLYGLVNWPSTAETNLTMMHIPSDSNNVYRIFTAANTGGTNSIPVRVTEKYDPTTKSWKQVPNLDSFPADSKNLYLDPVALNQAEGPLKFDFATGGVIWTDKNGVTHNDPISSVRNYNDLMDKLKADDPTKATQAQAQMSKSQVAAAQYAGKATSNVINNNDPTNSSRPDMSCGTTQLGCWIAKAIYYVTIKPASWLLAASGWFLDAVFLKTVVNLKATLQGGGNSSLYSVIKLVWGIFRDLINMSFIFLLLYASIKTILFADTTGLKKTITNIVIVALLMNFSLFFVELAIDVSNNFAVTIYNSISQQSANNQNNLAAAFMDKLSLQTLMGTAMKAGTAGGFTDMITISIFGSVFILVLAVVFFVMAILFLVRFIEFIILMMMSPIGMGAIAIPKLNMAFTDDGFWKNLMSQCIFAPIMFIFLWISIKILGVMTAPGVDVAKMMIDGQSAAKGLGTYILGFTVIIFILIKGMETAKSMASKGAGAVQSNFLKYSGANWAQNKMKNAPRGVGAFAGRNTAGRLATRFADSEWGRNMQTNALGRVINRGARKVSDAGFGGKIGFAKKEEELRKQKEQIREQLDKKSIGEQHQILTQELKNKREDEKLMKQKEQELEAQSIHFANESFTNHSSGKTDLEEKKRLAEEILKQQQDYLADPATQANSSYKEAAEKSVKKAEEELKKTNDEIDKLDETLIKAFKTAKIQIDPKDLASMATAKSALDAKNSAMALKAGLATTTSPKEVAKAYKQLSERQAEVVATEKRGLEEIKKSIDKESKSRQEQYAKSLASRRLLNLGLPSKASQQASLNIYKETNKTVADRDKDQMNKLIKKLLDVSDKPKDKPAEVPKP